MTFRDWLAGEMERRDISRRELARRMAANHPQGITPNTVDNCRRAIRRYLEEAPQVPIEGTQIAIAVAIGVDPSELPDGEEDEEEDLATRLQALAVEHKRLSRQLDMALKAATA